MAADARPSALVALLAPKSGGKCSRGKMRKRVRDERRLEAADGGDNGGYKRAREVLRCSAELKVAAESHCERWEGKSLHRQQEQGGGESKGPRAGAFASATPWAGIGAERPCEGLVRLGCGAADSKSSAACCGRRVSVGPPRRCRQRRKCSIPSTHRGFRETCRTCQ